MNEHLRERITRKLDALGDERGYQLLDYVEFLESKYAGRQSPSGTPLNRFTEAIEDRLRAGKVSATAIAETMSLLNRAANVLNGAVAAGKSVATDIYTVAQTASRPAPPQPPPQQPFAQQPPAHQPTPHQPPAHQPPAHQPPPHQPTPSREASSPAHDVREPGSGQERL